MHECVSSTLIRAPRLYAALAILLFPNLLFAQTRNRSGAIFPRTSRAHKILGWGILTRGSGPFMTLFATPPRPAEKKSQGAKVTFFDLSLYGFCSIVLRSDEKDKGAKVTCFGSTLFMT